SSHLLLFRAFFCFSCLLLPPSSTLFPYTTLFRSQLVNRAVREAMPPRGKLESHQNRPVRDRAEREDRPRPRRGDLLGKIPIAARSEEHTSELQSHLNLV